VLYVRFAFRGGLERIMQV